MRSLWRIKPSENQHQKPIQSTARVSWLRRGIVQMGECTDRPAVREGTKRNEIADARLLLL